MKKGWVVLIFLIAFSSIVEADDSKEKAQEMLRDAEHEIQVYGSEHNGEIPKFITIFLSEDIKKFKDYQAYQQNVIKVNTISQLNLIKSENPQNADEIIQKYRNVFNLAQALDEECKDCEIKLGGRLGWDCKDICKGMVTILAKGSANMAIRAADFCAKNKLKTKAKAIYREVIVNYPGIAYKPYLKQAEFGLEDLK